MTPLARKVSDPNTDGGRTNHDTVDGYRFPYVFRTVSFGNVRTSTRALYRADNVSYKSAGNVGAKNDPSRVLNVKRVVQIFSNTCPGVTVEKPRKSRKRDAKPVNPPFKLPKWSVSNSSSSARASREISGIFRLHGRRP